MDDWSALEAAAAIAQFIDFGIRLVSATVKTHKSPGGYLKRYRGTSLS
jgi:hypothetical protein